ncbi:MAG: hypothetical protein ACO3IB_13215 [Phycisphaerales bacterium]
MMIRTLLAASLLLVAPTALADGGKGKNNTLQTLLEADGHGVRGLPWFYQAPESLSSQFGIDAIPAPRITLDPIDHEFLLAEDEVRGANKPLRFAVSRPVDISLEWGEWIEVEGGSIWRVEISGDGALNGRLEFRGVALGAGEQLTVSVPGMEGSTVGPIEGVGEFGNGTAWGLCMPDAVTRIDWFVPAGARVKALPFDAVDYWHGYRDIWRGVMASSEGDGGVAGNCHNDPACYATWANESNGTVRLLFGGFLCSGQLTATTAADETPYITTANHCISTSSVANSCQFNFFYRRNTCGGTISAGVNITGADLSATQLASDNTLLMIRPTLPSGIGWVGWTNVNPLTNTPSTGLHHPSGDRQAISFGVKNANSFNCGSPSTNWHSLSWNSAVTEGGSSGSAI